MKYLLLILLTLTMTGCWKTVAPTGLAAVGAGVGSLGGPAGAFVGGGAGAAVGQLIKADDEVVKAKEETKEVIQAISEGDVKRMIELQAGQQKGTFDKIVDGIYRLLYLGAVLMLLWFVLPWLWAKKHVKKAVEGAINGNGETKNAKK
tara:strand:+ start:1299 stop:1742 length:444 start_codon:yes stop_codon:yes gene_type:complete